jgi:hypothetical protein
VKARKWNAVDGSIELETNDDLVEQDEQDDDLVDDDLRDDLDELIQRVERRTV